MENGGHLSAQAIEPIIENPSPRDHERLPRAESLSLNERLRPTAVDTSWQVVQNIKNRCLSMLAIPFGRESNVFKKVDHFMDSIIQTVEEDGTAQSRSAPAASTYDEYESIDWIRDTNIDRQNRQQIHELRNRPLNHLRKAYYRAQGWLYVTLVGIFTGFVAAVIAVAIDWLEHIRVGVCTDGMWKAPRICCRGQPDQCDAFKRWSDLIGVSNLVIAFFVDYFIFILLAVCFAGTAALFVRKFARYAAGSGIAEIKTILGGFVIKMFAAPQTLLIKSVGLILSVSSGLNLGKEGPMVHIAVCCGELFARLFSKYATNEAKKREILSAAAAAGVSVAFGAPIGGVLFSLEEASYYFPHKTLWRSFYCASLAALMTAFMNPYGTGKLVLFQVRYTSQWKAFEMVPFALIGVVGGLMGAFLIKMNLIVAAFRRGTRIKNFPIQEAMIFAAITAVCSFLNDFQKAGANELMAQLFDECGNAKDLLAKELCARDRAGFTIFNLLLAAAVKLILTVFTIGLKVPAGIYVPSLAMGACMGRAVGEIVSLMQSSMPDWSVFEPCRYNATNTACITPGVYAVIGAAAVLCGVTRMTVSLVVIMFEITGNLDYMLPIMITVMIAKWTGDAFGRESIYDEHILFNDYPFLDNKWEPSFKGRVAEIMKPTRELYMIELTGQNTIQSLRAFLQRHSYTGFPVVTDSHDMFIVGYISRTELSHALERANVLSANTRCVLATSELDALNRAQEQFYDLREFMDVAPIQVSSETPLNSVFDLFKRLGLRYILVCDQGKLAGIVTKKDMLHHIAITYHHRGRLQAGYPR